MQSAFWLGGPHGPFLRDTHLPIFLYCLKYKNVTLVSYNDHLQVERMKQTHAHICSALIIITFLSARIGWLCKIPACYCSNFIGCFRKYTNPGQDVYGINCTNGHPTSVTGRYVVCLQNRLASRTRRLIHFSLYSKNSVCCFPEPWGERVRVTWQKRDAVTKLSFRRHCRGRDRFDETPGGRSSMRKEFFMRPPVFWGLASRR